MPDSRGDRPHTPIAVTDAAKTYLADQLEHVSARNVCFRLRTGSDHKMSTTVTEPSPGDALVLHGGKVVLAIAPELAARLQDNTIDIERTDGGRQALIVL